MRLYNKIISGEDAVHRAFSYEAKPFELEMTANAGKFIVNQTEIQERGFKIDNILAQRTKIGEEQQKNIDAAAEALALEQLKAIEEKAYQEAYQLGLKEGHEKAFAESFVEINNRLDTLGELAKNISFMKTEILARNEVHVMKTLFFLAQRIALREIDKDEKRILPLLQKLIEQAQNLENVTVRLSPADFKFVEQSQLALEKGWEFLEKVKFLESIDITPGGCVLESNYGVIDATVEERIEKMWITISEKLPQLDEVG